MQFIAQIPLGEADIAVLRDRRQSLLLFQCQADPGMCDEWDPESGGNAAVLTPVDDSQAQPAPPGPTLLPSVSYLEFADYDDSVTADTPDDAYCSAMNAPGSRVLGKLGGRPCWIQGDETPLCACGTAMRFVVQLEERGGGGINFGDAGAGYGFVCDNCSAVAKFLWQCS